MLVTAKRVGADLYIMLDGEMDEHSAPQARRIADEIAQSNVEVSRAVFDLGGVSFMDSTGIGFLIGRFKTFRRYGIPVYIANPNLSADKVLSISGVYQLIPRV